MLKIHRLIVNPFEENTYVIIDDATREAIVVDAGMWNDRERRAFDAFVDRTGVNIQQIVNTHMHLDHCFGANYVKDKYGVKLAASSSDAFMGAGMAAQARRFGMSGVFDERGVEVDVELEDGDVIEVGTGSLEVIAMPGHSPGGIALYCREQNFVITGDSLFESAIGRTDLEGGDYPTLINSIKARLFTLPDNTDVFPGHGNPTTIGREKRGFSY